MEDRSARERIGRDGGDAPRHRSGPRRLAVEIIAIGVLFLATLLFLSAFGRAHVAYLSPPQIRIIQQPHDAYAVWREAKVAGRVLLLFDRQLNADYVDREGGYRLDDSFLAPDSYIYLASDQNVVRKVYHIIPDTAWAEVKAVLDSWPHVAPSQGMYRLIVGEGVPVFVLRARDVPALNEKVLVSINGSYWGEQEIHGLLEILKGKQVKSDLVTLAGPIAEGSIKEMREYYGNSHR